MGRKRVTLFFTLVLAHNKSFECAPSGPDALTRAAQFKRYVS